MAETVAEAMAGPCLATCSPAYWAAYMRGHNDGHVDGYVRGHNDVQDEITADDDELWSRAVHNVQATALRPTYATLCDRRGEPERAERARAHERRLGLAS